MLERLKKDAIPLALCARFVVPRNLSRCGKKRLGKVRVGTLFARVDTQAPKTKQTDSNLNTYMYIYIYIYMDNHICN